MLSERIQVCGTGDYSIEVQEKLRVIDPMEYKQQIEKLYFPGNTDKFPEFAYWEWGLDTNDVPRVFDWG